MVRTPPTDPPEVPSSRSPRRRHLAGPARPGRGRGGAGVRADEPPAPSPAPPRWPARRRRGRAAGWPVGLHTTQVKAAVTGYGAGAEGAGAGDGHADPRLSARPQPADAADALALAVCHAWRARPASARGAGTGTSGGPLTPAQQAWARASRRRVDGGPRQGLGSASYTCSRAGCLGGGGSARAIPARPEPAERRECW